MALGTGSIASGSRLVLLLLTAAAGCSRTPPGETTVRGSVSFNGLPVAGGLVVFSPDADRGGSGKPLSGTIEPDGSFRLRKGTAVPPGWYRVSIAPSPGHPAGSSLPFPGELARPDTSGLVREVKPGEENHIHFAIEAATR